MLKENGFDLEVTLELNPTILPLCETSLIVSEHLDSNPNGKPPLG